jgi:hypothetical protein
MTLNRGSNVRRTVSLTLSHPEMQPRDLYAFIATPGSIIRVSTGIDWSIDQQEIVPVFTGRPSTRKMTIGDSVVQVPAADFGFDIAAQKLLPAVIQAGTMLRKDAAKALLLGGIAASAFPTATVTITATDAGTLRSEKTWAGSRWDAISQLSKDGGFECFQLPDGNWLIQDLPSVGTPVYTFETHSTGTVKGIDREGPLDKAINTVFMTPGTTDGSQVWTDPATSSPVSAIMAQIADEDNPLHPSKIGVRQVEVSNTTAPNYAAARAAVDQRLQEEQAVTETYTITAVIPPCVEGGDSTAGIIHSFMDEPDETITGLISSVSLSLDYWSGTVTAQNLPELV